MFLWEFLKNCYKWKSLFILAIPLFILFKSNLNNEDYSNNYDKYKDIIELLSWLFSGIMSLVGISTLFLAFTYENKLIVASKDLKRVLKPYSLSVDDLRNIIINYKNSIIEDPILKILYRSFIIMSFFVIFVWGAVVGFYTKFKFSFNLDLSIGSLLVFGVYVFWGIIVISLILLAIAIKFVRLNKDPLDNGYLPKPVELCNVDFINGKKGDILEFFYINSPNLELFKNVSKTSESFDLVFQIPIKVSGFRFILKLYDNNYNTIITLYSFLKESVLEADVGDRSTYTVTNKFEKEIYNKLNDNKIFGVLKIYDHELKLVGKYRYKYYNENDYSFRFILDKKMHFENGKIDIDANILKSPEAENRINYQRDISNLT